MHKTNRPGRIAYVDMAMSGHASRSGYTQVARGTGKHLPARVIAPERNPGVVTRAITSMAAGLAHRSGNQWYNRRSLRAECSSIREIASQRDTTIHYLYGENNFRYAGSVRRSWLGRNSRLVATYHTPEHRFHELIQNTQHIAALDAVVIMSEVQRAIFSELLDTTRVHFIPHGVDTKYFTPAAENGRHLERETIRCITVGSHLRDYDSLSIVANHALQTNLNIEFVVVANPVLVDQLHGLANVQCLHSIDDNQLLKLYQSSDLLLLPLKDATANNTLLEGMACGLPVLASDLIGVRDYAPGNEALYAQNTDAIMEHLSNICFDKHDLQKMGAASRRRALDLSWDNVRAQLAKLYTQL